VILNTLTYRGTGGTCGLEPSVKRRASNNEATGAAEPEKWSSLAVSLFSHAIRLAFCFLTAFLSHSLRNSSLSMLGQSRRYNFFASLLLLSYFLSLRNHLTCIFFLNI
jgi:hypothetical protein